jgi:Flp pilus assembly pilin Flp
MWSSQHLERLWTALSARTQDELGAAMVEYTVIAAAFAIAVIGGLSFLGGAVGGSFTDVVINALGCRDSPLNQDARSSVRPCTPPGKGSTCGPAIQKSTPGSDIRV